MLMDYEIYSIESRKGGVGKTTIALNLAKVLISKGYDVLLIDCDITGTPISEAATHSPFWKDSVKVWSQNLIGYYESDFLSGKHVSNGLVCGLEYERDKIHLIGSEIYNSNGELIIDPRNLMDDLHSYWFLDMIKGIAAHFCGLAKSKQKAVIFDNSPGYVGIGRSLREWLTSIGPQYAHFVLVSSLDEQDIESTISSATEIKNMMVGKLALAKCIKGFDARKDDCQGRIDVLLSQQRRLSDFYYSLVGGEDYPSDINKEYSLSDYVKAVVNRVPDGYLEEGRGYHFNDNDDLDRKQLINELFPKEEGKSYPFNIINYDNSISGQFIESSIERPNSELNDSKLRAEFKRFESYLMTYKSKDDKYNYLSYLIKAFHSMVTSLEDANYKRMAKTFRGEMMPESNVVEMAENVRMLGNMAYPGMDKHSFSKDGMVNTTKQQMKMFISEYGLYDYSSVLISQLDGIYKKAGAERQNGNIFQLFNLTVMMRMIIDRYRKLYKKNYSFRDFVKNEFLESDDSVYDWNHITGKNLQIDEEKIIRLDSELIEMMNSYYRNFYPAYCYSLLKMIDCVSDFQLVVNACRDTIGYGARVFNHEIEAYLRDVLVTKTLDFTEKSYKEAVADPLEMKTIQKLINKHIVGL